MVADSRGYGQTAYLQAGFIRIANSYTYHFSEVQRAGGWSTYPATRVIEIPSGALQAGQSYDYAEWRIPGNRFQAFVNGSSFPMQSVALTGWQVPLKDQYSGEVFDTSSDMPGFSNAPTTFDPMVVRGQSGTWHYTPCGMALGAPGHYRYHVSTDNSCRRFSI